MTAVAISLLTIPKTYSFIQELYILIILSLLILHACIILYLVTNWNDKKFAFITKQ